ncbi:MAG: glycosyltransferase family 4 protein [Chromatiaceae bacterium]|nr:glycosyltransferase family 4 protein [Chromatiaceae bacterium]
MEKKETIQPSARKLLSGVRFILVEGCDFLTTPPGGQLNFAKQLIKVYKNRIGLVGYTQHQEEIGRWTIKSFDDFDAPFFGIRLNPDSLARPTIPLRLSNLLWLKRFKQKILMDQKFNYFVQAPEILFEVSTWPKYSICFRFPGVENPLLGSRYAYAKYFANTFDKYLAKSLDAVDCILTSANSESVYHAACRIHRPELVSRAQFFPTRVDTALFFPRDKQSARAELGLPSNLTIFVFSGRLNHVKGWRFVLESFSRFRDLYKDCMLVIAGDGEDRNEMLSEIEKLDLSKDTQMLGNVTQERLGVILSAADALLVGSLREGWPTATVEALACGTPVVSTLVSGSAEIIKEGVCGIVVDSRDPKQFVSAMRRVLQLPNQELRANSVSSYTTNTLESDLGKAWEAW